MAAELSAWRAQQARSPLPDEELDIGCAIWSRGDHDAVEDLVCADQVGRHCASRRLEMAGLVIPLIYLFGRGFAEGEGVPRWAEVGGHGLWFYYHEEHQVPHVAVRGEHRATVRLEDGEVLAGHLPAKLHRAVRRFLAEHRDEAYAAWEATRRQEPPDRLS